MIGPSGWTAGETRLDVAFPDGETVRMVTTLHPTPDPIWTRMSAQGYASQVTKLDQRYGAGAG